MLQEILKRLTDTMQEQIERLNFDECKHRMKDIKNQKILLAIDNVSESYKIVEQAKLILRAGFEKSSIVVVIARSLGELQNLKIEESECMEMLELTMDDAISLFVREVACDKSIDDQLIRQCVERCYFSEGDGSNFHYHPLALQVLGGQLGSDSSQWLEKLKEIDVFNLYREKPDKHPIFSILRRSFDILKDEDKLLFMDCALFAIHYSHPLTTSGDLYEWLSMIHGKSIKSRLNGLKWKSLIQTLEEGTTRIGVHDLWREFCIMETKVGQLKSRHWVYEHLSGSSDPYFEESSTFNGVWKGLQRVSMLGTYTRPCNMHLNLSRCFSLVALHLGHIHLESNVLDSNGVNNLKSLQIKIHSNCKVYGLKSLSKLCLLEWIGKMPSNVAFIEEIGGLTNLQILNLSTQDSSAKFPNLSTLSLLQRAAFYGLNEGVTLSYSFALSNLRELHLKNCKSLRRFDGRGDLLALEELQISWCPNLEELPNLQLLKNLKKLYISSCTSLQTLSGVGDLATLLLLLVSECPNLVDLPDLSKLTNLRVLQLRKCSLNRVVTELSELINLQECRISSDGIGEFSDLHKLTKLQSINVDGWSPQGSLGVDSLVNLEEISIADCRGVESLGGLSKITRLHSLQLVDCEFKDVACLKDLIGLRELKICGCNLLERFPDMHKATGLETLYISYCENLQEWELLNRTSPVSCDAVGVDLQSGGSFPNLRNLFFFDMAISELPDLSNFPQLEVLTIYFCPSLVGLTSSVPWTNLKEFTVRASGIKMSEDQIEYLRVVSPTIVIDIA